MDKIFAKELVNELERHPAVSGKKWLIKLSESFPNILQETGMPKENFSFSLPDVTIQSYWGEYNSEEHSFHDISLRRVFRNLYARNNIPSDLSRFYDSAVSLLPFSVYSSDRIMRNLLSKQDYLDMMEVDTNPFTLLGKLDTYRVESGNEYHIERPLVVIPCLNEKDREKLNHFEMLNSVIRVEDRAFFFREFDKRISPEDFYGSFKSSQ